MKKQIVTIMLGAIVMLGTATSLFAQTSGLAIGGGAAGGPNGIYKDPGLMPVQINGKTVQLRTMKVRGHTTILVPMYMSCDVFHVHC